MNPTTTCRPALPKDFADVLDLTKNIWDGHDYVPHTWQDWLKDPNGILASAEYGGRVVGVGKLDLISPGDWWMMGLRVHPDLQGQKIASHLHDYLLSWWHRCGNGTVRLSTMDVRYSVQHLCQRTGFHKLMEIAWYARDASPDPEALARFRPVLPSESSQAFDTLLTGELLPLYHGLLDYSWTWARPHLSIIEKFIGDGKLWWWQAPNAAPGLVGGYEDLDDENPLLVASMPSCRREHFPLLLNDLPSLAASTGFVSVQIVAPLDPNPLPEIAAARFTRAWDHSMFIFEKQHP